jgi:hypothetical protein
VDAVDWVDGVDGVDAINLHAKSKGIAFYNNGGFAV